MSTGIVSRSGEEENTEGAVGVNSEVLDEGNTVSRRTQQETLKHFLRMINMPMLLELKGFPGFILNVTSSEEPFQTAMQAKVSSPPVQSIASVSAIVRMYASLCVCASGIFLSHWTVKPVMAEIRSFWGTAGGSRLPSHLQTAGAG